MSALIVVGLVVLGLAAVGLFISALSRSSGAGRPVRDEPAGGHRATPATNREAPAEPGAEDQFPMAGDAAPAPIVADETSAR
jgi:hypothetical protein